MSEEQRDAGQEDAGGIDATTQLRAVRERYAAIASERSAATEGVGAAESSPSGCCDAPATDSGCCSSDQTPADSNAAYSAKLGYTQDDIDAVVEGANLGLGCGNPTAIASLEPGETVLDLGSGGGFDCFLAAREVGETGTVIGVDMTPEMVERARENAARNDADNVEFRLGEIEHLPVADETIDVVISNCVVNLSPDKPQVFREVYRVLRPGGRLSISDVVLTAPIPPAIQTDPTALASCIAGAAPKEDVEEMLRAAGFIDVAVTPEDDSDAIVSDWDDERDLSEFIVSSQITGRKPFDG